MGGDDQIPIILEGVGWKRRGGFAKYSNSVGAGSSWERRRFALTPTQLNYYASSNNSAGTSSPTKRSLRGESPRGSLTILPERATITATYPGDPSQPTPYALTIKTIDTISGAESTKWKVCVDDRETQLIWLVALTDIVADASVKEYNAKVLAKEIDKSVNAGGFHRLYEEGDGRLLDLVHGALLSSGGGKDGISKRAASSSSVKGDEGMEVLRRSGDSMDDNATFNTTASGSDDTTASDVTTPLSPGLTPNNTTAVEEKIKGNNRQLPRAKLCQALAVITVCLVYENWAQTSTSLLWQFVNAIILCICFYPPKMTNDGKGSSKESDAMQSTPGKKSNNTEALTETMIGTQLLKSEGVPLSGMSSQRFPPKQKPNSTPNRLQPLTEDEMEAHLHERWAMSAPTIDLSGSWTLIADGAFKTEYDAYLKGLGFSGITRRVACGLIARTTEVTKQLEGGRELYLKGTNPKGAWERTLESSGYPDFETLPEKNEGEDYEHSKSSIKTADSEDVDAEAWWEERGTKHRSWLRGGTKYGGGDFESVRYLEEGSDCNVLICESFFHPKDKSKKSEVVTWRFKRD